MPLGRQRIAERGGMASRGMWHARRNRARLPLGRRAPSARHGNFDFQRWDPAPVGSFPAGPATLALPTGGQRMGMDAHAVRAFSGFRAVPFYPGYSANFFDGKHFVMKGGSPRTAACMLRRSFRNWFQPHYPYVYATFAASNAEARGMNRERDIMATAVIAQHSESGFRRRRARGTAAARDRKNFLRNICTMKSARRFLK